MTSTLKRCTGCGNRVPAEDMTAVNDDGLEVCPRCVFILALYHLRGIEKTFEPGGLSPERINSEFRRILETEFNINPRECYIKHLGPVIRDQEIKSGIVNVESSALDRLNEWPFVLLPMEYRAFRPAAGRLLRISDGKREVLRRIFKAHTIKAEYAKKYGASGDAIACYVPEEKL